MTTALAVALSLLTGFGIVWGGVVGWKQIRSTTAADQRAAAADRAKELADTRIEERRSSDEDKQALRDQLEAMTKDRDYWRARYDKCMDTRLGGPPQ